MTDTYSVKVVRATTGIVKVDAASEDEAREKAIEMARSGETPLDFNQNWSTNQVTKLNETQYD